MLFSPLAWAILSFTLLITVPGALASSTPRRPKKQPATRVTVESYPAIIGEEEVSEINIPRKMRQEGALSAPPAAPKKVDEKFVVVPEEKREQILKRMKLCQSLFMETGRAYDYRAMTTFELEKELNAIRLAKASQAEQEKDPILSSD